MRIPMRTPNVENGVTALGSGMPDSSSLAEANQAAGCPAPGLAGRPVPAAGHHGPPRRSRRWGAAVSGLHHSR